MGFNWFLVFLILGSIPVIFLLSLFVYKQYCDLREKKFENGGCRVLTRERLGDIVNSSPPSHSIEVFKSAVIDHSHVEGISYYTKCPFGSKYLIAHDKHRRSFIANWIGEMLSKNMILNSDMESCRDILSSLIQKPDESYYTELLAWNSYSKLPYLYVKKIIEEGGDNLKRYISEGFMRGLGVIKFAFNLKTRNDLELSTINLINDLIIHALENGSLTLAALVAFKIYNRKDIGRSQKKEFHEHMPQDKKFICFMDHLYELSLGFMKDEVSEGLRNLGLQSVPYSPKSTEGEIVNYLIRDCLEEVYIPASYILHTFNSDAMRPQPTDFLWV